MAHFCFALLASGEVARYLDDCDQFGLFLASICHDIDHRGRNNAFMIKANDPLARLYPDSVMEQHHFSFTVTLLADPAVNILAPLSSAEYSAVLQQVRHVILATDLAIHFQTRGAIRELATQIDRYASTRAPLVAAPCVLAPELGPAALAPTRRGRYDRNNPEHRHLVTSLFMTASDVNSVTKPWESAVGVTKSLFTEFFMQARCRDSVHVVRQRPAADRRGAGALRLWTNGCRATRSAPWACSRS